MGDANEDREKAAKLPEGDLVRILYTQHALAKEMMDQVESAAGDDRKQLFTQLTTTLKAHETAEEAVVRPVTTEAGAGDVAEARNDEESEADEIILALKELDVDSPEFDSEFATFKQAVSDHAEAEENRGVPDPSVEAVGRRSPDARKGIPRSVRSRRRQSLMPSAGRRGGALRPAADSAVCDSSAAAVLVRRHFVDHERRGRDACIGQRQLSTSQFAPQQLYLRGRQRHRRASRLPADDASATTSCVADASYGTGLTPVHPGRPTPVAA